MISVIGLPPEAKAGQLVSLDVEMYRQPSLKIHRPTGEFACLSVAMDGDPNVYQITDSHDVRKVLSLVKKGVWVIHNATYDLTQLRRWATINERYIWDTQLVERVLYGGLYDEFSLKALARRYLGLYMNKETRDDFETAYVMTPEMAEYAAEDARTTLLIAKIQREEHSSYLWAYELIDQPAIFPTIDMQPIKIDRQGWETYVNELIKLAADAEAEVGLNVYSQKAVLAALAKRGLHIRDTKAATLEEYASNEFVAGILKARMYRKAVSTYGMSWLEKYVEEGDLVYPSAHITGAETGRMSYSDPNLQNIPQRRLPKYRSLFISQYGRLIVSDAHQQEPCTLAYESQDEELLRAVRNGEDLHQTVADAIHQTRFMGKTINLATSYGMTARGMSKRTGLSERECQTILNQYFMRFRGVFAWISRQRSDAHRIGYVRTVAGRRIWMNPYNYQWENNAINAPIQGGAADFTKMWVRKSWEMCRDRGVPYSLCGVIHDETIFDPPKEYFKATKQIQLDAFHETAKALFKDVPFRQESKAGKNWACKELEENGDEEDDE